MSDTEDLTFSDRIRVWRASGLSITLNPAGIAALDDWMNAVSTMAARKIIEAEEIKRKARRELKIQVVLAAITVAAALGAWMAP